MYLALAPTNSPPPVQHKVFLRHADKKVEAYIDN